MGCRFLGSGGADGQGRNCLRERKGVEQVVCLTSMHTWQTAQTGQRGVGKYDELLTGPWLQNRNWRRWSDPPQGTCWNRRSQLRVDRTWWFVCTQARWFEGVWQDWSKKLSGRFSPSSSTAFQTDNHQRSFILQPHTVANANPITPLRQLLGINRQRADICSNRERWTARIFMTLN